MKTAKNAQSPLSRGNNQPVTGAPKKDKPLTNALTNMNAASVSRRLFNEPYDSEKKEKHQETKTPFFSQSTNHSVILFPQTPKPNNQNSNNKNNSGSGIANRPKPDARYFQPQVNQQTPTEQTIKTTKKIGQTTPVTKSVFGSRV